MGKNAVNHWGMAIRDWVGIVLFLLGFFLYAGQNQWTWWTFANLESGRIYVLACFALISVGIGLMLYEPGYVGKAIGGGLLIFFLSLAVTAILGWIGLQDVGDPEIYAGNGFYFALDSAADTVSTTVAVVQTLIQLIPYILLIVAMILLFTANTGGDYIKALILFFIGLVMLTAFYFLGGIFGFAYAVELNVVGNIIGIISQLPINSAVNPIINAAMPIPCAA